MDQAAETYQCLSPVAITVFNRPDKTQILLDALRHVTPKKVYVISDGARENHSTDQEKVDQVRNLISEKINWGCEVTKIYAEKNMGGPKRVPSGLDEVFKKEERAIIFDDDCIPSQQFFIFVDELLERYKDDKRIGTICGYNTEFDFLGRPIENKRKTSYFFSRVPASWGWATWRRVWQNFDREMKDFPDMIDGDSFQYFSPLLSTRRYFKKRYTLLHKGIKEHWDLRLTYSLFKQNQLSVIPNSCLVSNIGFDGSGLHFKGSGSYMSLKKISQINTPLTHPTVFQPDYNYEKRSKIHFFTNNKFYKGMGIVRNFLLRKKYN